ncbi:hypothetical protein NFI96_028959 [Prochilodus magdalenae]|nr:hypothetical protein NFI96_028959 [Prochilodus magdalenae]
MVLLQNYTASVMIRFPLGTSPAPSSLSLKSEGSMHEPLAFAEATSKEHQRLRIKPSSFGEMIQKFEQTGISPAAVSPNYARPGDTACEVCAGRKLKAVKSCVNRSVFL